MKQHGTGSPRIPVVQSLLEILLQWLRDKPCFKRGECREPARGLGFATANDLVSRLRTDSVHHCFFFFFCESRSPLLQLLIWLAFCFTLSTPGRIQAHFLLLLSSSSLRTNYWLSCKHKTIRPRWILELNSF